jgi:hypothetical protein
VASARWLNNGKLMELGDQPGSDITARLLLALTALYVERLTHTHDEQRQYVELALRLIDRVDEMTQVTVAEILAGSSAAPPEVRARLARLNADGAASASRDAPIQRRDGTETVASVAPAPTAAVAAYAALPPDALGEAFFAANAVERRNLLALAAHHRAAATRDGAARDSAARDGEDADAVLDFSGLDTAAQDGRIGEFIRELEQLLSIPRSLSERIVNDGSGEPFVIAAKAVGMPIAVLQRILLLVNPAVSHSVQRVYDLTDLYHTLDRTTAAGLLTLWRDQAHPDEAASDPRMEVAKTRPGAARLSADALRSRFGALTERLSDSATSRPGRENVARRGLRSR